MEKQRHILIFCLLTWSMPFMVLAGPQQHDTLPTPKPAVKELKEVQVRAMRQEVFLTPQQTLKGEQLQRLNSFSVADAIRYFSGVQLKDYGGIGGLKTVNIRSMGTNHVGVFYDGIQLGNAQNGQVDLGKFSLDNVEEITLYNGQRSLLLQPAKAFASSGTVYINSRKPSFEKGQYTQLTAKFKTGSFGLVNPSLFWQQKITEHIAATISTELVRADGSYRFRYWKKLNGVMVYDTTARRKNADVAGYRVEAAVHSQFRDSSELTVKGYGYWSERGLPGAIVNNVWSNPQRQWDKNLFLQSSYKKKFNSSHSLLLNVKYADDYTHYVDPDIGNFPVDNHYYQKELYASAAWRYSITNFWDMAAAVDYQYNKLDANLYRFPYPTRHTLLGSLSSAIQWHKFELQGNLLATMVSDKVKQFAGAGDKTEYTPSIALSWQPFRKPDFIVRSFYKHIFRMPTFNDLYYTFIGNSALLPEYTKQYNLGVHYNRTFTGVVRSVSFQTDAYYNEVSNKIVAVPTANLFRWMMINLGRVEIRGVDVATGAGFGWGNWLLNAKLSYTYQKAQDKTDKSDANYNHQIPYIPWNSGSLILGLQYKTWNLNYSTIYTGERYNQKTNIPENYVQPWYTHDLTVAKSFAVQKLGCSVSAEVNNVFNQQYDVVLNYPMPGRNYKIILSVKL